LQPNEAKIAVFDDATIDEVAEIFESELPMDFCSVMGPGFLRRYFLPYFLDADPHIGYVAIDQGRVVGFVLGAKATGYYVSFTKKHPVILAKYSLAACIRDIRNLGYFLGVGRVMFGTDAFKPFSHDLELLYISVAEDCQGRGIGLGLVRELLREAQRLGFARCVVKTLTATENTNRFYRKCGFEPLHRHQGRIWYAHPTEPVKVGTNI